MKVRALLLALVFSLCASPLWAASTGGTFWRLNKNHNGPYDLEVNDAGDWYPVLSSTSVLKYGADPSAVADSCAAIKAALAAVPAYTTDPFGAEMVFPAGVYTTTCWPTITDKRIKIRGAGSQQTTVTFTGTGTPGADTNSAGIVMHYTTVLRPEIEGVHLQTNAVQSAAACIDISASDSGDNLRPIIRDVICDSFNSGYWQDGIKCTYCTFLSVDATFVRGLNPGATATIGASNMQRGFYLDNTIDANIRDTHVYWARKAFSLDNHAEGAKIEFSSVVQADYGVYAETGWESPNLVVGDSHFNVTTCGICFAGRAVTGPLGQLQLRNNLIYRWLNSTGAWYGIRCADGGGFSCDDAQWSGNNIIAFRGGGPTGTSYCFGLAASQINTHIHDNQCRAADYFADMGSAVVPTIVVENNTVEDLGSNWVANPNKYAVFRNNSPVVAGAEGAFGGVGLNNTQWNVGGENQLTLATNASMPTTVTDAIGGHSNQILTVYCVDANTTLANDAGVSKFRLAGGVNFACSVGATITLRYVDQWMEIARTSPLPSVSRFGVSAWTAYASTLTWTGGTPTGATVAMRYDQSPAGKTIAFSALIYTGSALNGATAVKASLPFTQQSATLCPASAINVATHVQVPALIINATSALEIYPTLAVDTYYAISGVCEAQ